MKELMISREELRALPEYSCSVPTGVVIGKQWRRDVQAYRMNGLCGKTQEPEWQVCEYVSSTAENFLCLCAAIPDGAKLKDYADIKTRWAVDVEHNVHRGDLSNA